MTSRAEEYTQNLAQAKWQAAREDYANELAQKNWEAEQAYQKERDAKADEEAAKEKAEAKAEEEIVKYVDRFGRFSTKRLKNMIKYGTLDGTKNGKSLTNAQLRALGRLRASRGF